MKQAAIYVRVSTTQQKEEATIESQKSALLKFANEQGYEIPSQFIFEDNGVSGAVLARPSLDKLRDLASEGYFRSIFILSPDRLSRKYAYQAVLIEEFKKHGVHIYFKSSPPSNTPGETLLEQMQGMFAEYERAQITERTRRGKLYKARNGSVNVLTKAPYGYKYISVSASLPAYFEIIDHDAQIVRKIFDLYVKERSSIRQIKDYLFNHKIPSPKGNPKWQIGSIAGLLKTSAYRGVAYFGARRKADPNPMRLPKREVRMNGRKTPRRASLQSPESEWIEIPVPPIVSNEIFDLAQELRSKNKTLSKRNTKKGTLLQGLISCKECGYGFSVHGSGKKSDGYGYYRCNNPIKGSCKSRGIRINLLDQAIWNSIIEVLNSPELIQNEISKRLLELKREPIMEKQRQLKKQILQLELESNRLLDAYQEGCIEMEELKNRMSIIKRQTNNFQRELSKESSGLSQGQLLELNTAIEYFSKRLSASHENLSLEEKRKVLRILVREILIGQSEIVINHILPWGQIEPSDEIACLCQEHGKVDLRFATDLSGTVARHSNGSSPQWLMNCNSNLLIFNDLLNFSPSVY